MGAYRAILTALSNQNLSAEQILVDVSWCLGHFEAVSTERDLVALIQDACKAAHIDYYHISNRFRTVVSPGPGFRMSNLPDDWLKQLRSSHEVENPLLRAGLRTVTGFQWRDLNKLLLLRSREQTFLDVMSTWGLVDGFTVPTHLPGEGLGLASFASGTETFGVPEKAAAELIGRYAFEAARRLAGGLSSCAASLYRLTPRQRQCLTLVARGKSDSVIAQILGLKTHTVTQHIEEARKRFSVASRSQLLVHALLHCELSYSEIIDGLEMSQVEHLQSSG